MVTRLGPDQRLAIGDRNLFPSTAFHLELRLRVEAIDALVIDVAARLAQFQINHVGAVPAMAVRQRENIRAQGAAANGLRDVPERRRAHADHR